MAKCVTSGSGASPFLKDKIDFLRFFCSLRSSSLQLLKMVRKRFGLQHNLKFTNTHFSLSLLFITLVYRSSAFFFFSFSSACSLLFSLFRSLSSVSCFSLFLSLSSLSLSLSGSLVSSSLTFLLRLFLSLNSLPSDFLAFSVFSCRS